MDRMDDRQYMLQAIRLAQRGAGYVEPNPMVGCVLVKSDRIVGRGFHRRFGQAHAEINALADAGPRARGATCYVTLEPCAHYGKTPPCADALVAAGVKRVVIGCPDPNPASTGGQAILHAAGIDVAVGICATECSQLIAPFTKTVRKKMPWVIAKWAATIDGKIATRTGDSQWITSPESRRFVHRLRARVDAVIIGVNTAITDNPRLTARHVRTRRIARRIVIDPRLRLPSDCRLIESLDRAPLTLAVAPATLKTRKTRARELADLGVEILPVKRRADRRGRLDLADLLRQLYRRHAATNVFVEGGSTTHGAFFGQHMVDELLVFLGPMLLGDSQARPPLDLGQSVRFISQARRMKRVGIKRIGDDVMIRYRPT